MFGKSSSFCTYPNKLQLERLRRDRKHPDVIKSHKLKKGKELVVNEKYVHMYDISLIRRREGK